MKVYRVLLVSIVLICLSGCASMFSTKEELQSISENEGVVIGSVLLTAATFDHQSPGWDFLKAPKSSEVKWTILIQEVKPHTLFSTWTKPYLVRVVTGKEEIFIKKLPAGNYKMVTLRPHSYKSGVYFNLGVDFAVRPRQVSYIGSFAAGLPNRVEGFSSIRFGILDFQDEVVEKLRGEYSFILGNVVKSIATSDIALLSVEKDMRFPVEKNTSLPKESSLRWPVEDDDKFFDNIP